MAADTTLSPAAPPPTPAAPADASARSRRAVLGARAIDRVLLISALVSLPILLLVPLAANGYWFNLLTNLFIFATLASAWNIIGGYTGYAAFGNVAFYGGGAYVTAILMTRAGWPFLAAMLAGGALMAAYGALIGIPVLRLKGHYFAIATLGTAIVTREICNNWELTGASRPINLPVVNDPNLFYYTALGLLVVAVVTAYAVANSKLGYGLVAIRENEEAAVSLGINATRFKVLAFAINAALCGLAGGVYAYWHVTIDPPTVFSLDNNVRLIIMAVLGGIGTPLGPVIGAALLTGIQETLWSRFTDLHSILFGLAIIVVVLVMPRGVVYLIRQRVSWRAFLRGLRQYRA